jgi:hypothetical protein
LIANVRLTSPYRLAVETGSGINIEHVTVAPSFWHGVSDSIWARIWWLEALRSGVAFDLSAPVGVHRHLLEQFAVGPNLGFSPRGNFRGYMRSSSKLAVWSLVRYQQIISTLGISKFGFESDFDLATVKVVVEQTHSVEQNDLDLDYGGLGEHADFVKDLIRLSQKFVIESNNEKEEVKFITPYLNAIRDYLQLPGLEGLIACRCAVNVIKGLTVTNGAMIPKVDKDSLMPLVNDIRSFFENQVSENRNLNHPSQSTYNFLNAITHESFMRMRWQPFRESMTDQYNLDYNMTSFLPKYFRIKSKGEKHYLLDILENQVRLGKEPPFQWMKTMDLPDWVIRPLIEHFSDSLPNLLAWFSKKQFIFVEASPMLRVQDTNRILKIARKSNDLNILRGAAIALSMASFRRLAEPDLILKILQYAPRDRFSNTLFQIDPVLDNQSAVEIMNKEFDLTKNVAQSVLNFADKYPFQIVCNAAAFMSEYNQLDLNPLLKDDRLNETVNQDILNHSLA